MHFGTLVLVAIGLAASISLLQRPERQRQIRDQWRLLWQPKPRLPRPARLPHWRVRLALWWVKRAGRFIGRHLLKLGICALILWSTYQFIWWLDRQGAFYHANTFTTHTDQP